MYYLAMYKPQQHRNNKTYARPKKNRMVLCNGRDFLLGNTTTTTTVPLTPPSPRSFLSTGGATETPHHVDMVQRELVPVLVPLEVVWG